MNSAQSVTLGAAMMVGFVHTLIGVDHYLPFIVLGRAEGWTHRKTMLWTFICGLGHVLSSMIIGVFGVALGWALGSIQGFESIRGQIASLALIGFGLLYFVWGLWRSVKGHAHVHRHLDGSLHDHPHPHPHDAVDPRPDHEVHAHEEPEHVAKHRRTIWVLFIIFVLGPCEALVPLLVAPAARHDLGGCLAVAVVFSAATVATMMALVAIGSLGVRLVRVEPLERHAHALAGFAILVSGLLIQLLGV